MSDPTPAELLRHLLRAAADAEALGPHPADDLEQLTVWALGQLPEAEENVLVEHLSCCGNCRRRVADLVRSGVLEVVAPETTSALSEPVTILEPPVSRIRSRRRWWAAVGGMALAASLLLALGWLAWRSGPGSDIAQARRDLAAGDYTGARDRLERNLPRITDPAKRSEAVQLLEEAGYALARRELEEKKFDTVTAAIGRWRQLGVESVRLDNLRLQAERRFSAEYALARDRSLLDYGYEMNGFAPAKPLPEVTDAIEAQLAKWAKLQSCASGDLGPALNRGQFLLALWRFKDAAAVFEEILRTHADDVDAHIGVGLTAYLAQDFPKALTHFQAAVKQRPDDAAAQINLAMTLERLDRPAEARSHWEKALEQTTAEEQRQAIRQHLQS